MLQSSHSYLQVVISSRIAHVHARIQLDFSFFAVTSVTAKKQTHTYFQRNDTSVELKRHVVCDETTRRL